jgi:uncharacterized membrane protein YeaQ/YmgE (transglycosylase-associated protein family)
MGFIWYIIIGIVAGFLAGKIMRGGGSLGPLLVALLVAPYGRQHLIVFAFVALAAIGVMYPICKWYKSYLNRMLP